MQVLIKLQVIKSKETKNLVKALKAATDRAQDPETLFRRSSNDLQALVRWIRKTLHIRNISEDDERLSGNVIMDEALRMLQKEAEADNMSPIEKANFIVAQIDGSAALKNWAPLLETMSALKFDQEALGDLPDRELFVGISAFNESVEAIRPTIESLFKHGGNRTRRFHVVIVKDCLKHPSQNDRIDSQPYGVSWESPDKRIALVSFKEATCPPLIRQLTEHRPRQHSSFLGSTDNHQQGTQQIPG